MDTISTHAVTSPRKAYAVTPLSQGFETHSTEITPKPVARPLAPSARVRKFQRRVVQRTIEVFDPDRLIDLVAGGRLEHRLLDPGAFEVRALHIESARFRLNYFRYSAGVAIKGEMANRGVAIGFALRMPGDMVAFGVPHQTFGLMQFDPTADLDIRLPAGGEWAVLCLDAAEFESEMAARGRYRALTETTDGAPLRVPDPHRRRLASLLRTVIEDGSQAVAGEQGWNLDDMLLDAFLAAYAAARPPVSKGHGALARRRRLVARTEEYIYAHVDDSIRMRQLCRDIGASARTLEYAFKGVYGVGVMESLRTMRLNEVRKKLLRSTNSTDVTVTTAAMDWGFWHLGEFAAAYRRLFGELPSQTLRPGRHSV